MMEENSEAHMETDVTSTTDDVPEVQEVTGSQGDVEMVLVVQQINEDENGFIEPMDKSSVKEISSASTAVEISPLKETLPENTRSPNKDSNIHKSPPKSPSASETPTKVLNVACPSHNNIIIPYLSKIAESADSSTKVKSLDKNKEKILTPKCTQVQKVVHKSPFKDYKLLEGQKKDHEETSVSPEPSQREVTEKSPTSSNKVEMECLIEDVTKKESGKDEILQQNDTAKIKKSEETIIIEETVASDHVNYDSYPHLNTDKKELNDELVSVVVMVERDSTNDSQSSDISEKRDKSISRELKSLIKSAKESKIISECTQLTSKTRKSRSHLDTSSPSLNNSMEPEKITKNRRASTYSQASNCSEQSEKTPTKRSMRSQNPEFVNKCKQFLNSVTHRVTKDSEEVIIDDDSGKRKPETDQSQPSPVTPKKKKLTEPPVCKKSNSLQLDMYCWRCHWSVDQEDSAKSAPPVDCSVCPRSFHFKCLSPNERKISTEKTWVCPECLQILHAESSETRSQAMKKIPLGMLCELLNYALTRMMIPNGVEPFMQPVDRKTFPDYDKYVVHPMDLNQMKQNIAAGHYGSTEAFLADAQWILHNSIIFNTLQSKLTIGARALVRSCKAEMSEIETCPECYAAAHARKPTWFTDVCTTPHILLWAKLKGFPYWPAKGMTVNSSAMVDVRFFGAHDRAWVPAKDCFLYSEKDPNNFRNKRQDIVDSMKEAELHIRNLSRKYGKFVYPPFKTQFDPSKLTEQLKIMIPTFDGEIKINLKEKAGDTPSHRRRRSASTRRSVSRRRSASTRRSVSRRRSASTRRSVSRRRSNSRAKSCTDGEVSESDETSTSARVEPVNKNQDKNELEIPMDVEIANIKEIETRLSRKRRRSRLSEAVITVMEKSETPEKNKKVDNIAEKKADQLEPSSSKEDKSTNKEATNSKEDKGTDKETTKSREDKPSNKVVSELTPKKKHETRKSKSRDEEPSSSTAEDKEPLRVTPIKLVALPRTDKLTPKLFTTLTPTKSSTPKESDKNQKTKPITPVKPRERSKELKRRMSRTSKSANASLVQEKNDKKSDSGNESSSSKELRSKDSGNKKKAPKENKSASASLKPLDVAIQAKDRIQFDDDTSLAVLARGSKHSNPSLPTITSVCSLSPSVQNNSKGNAISNDTVQASSDSSIFKPTSSDSIRNMNDAANKLQKLRNETEPVFGRVGVRAFARMTSPERNNDLQVEIKAEPIDLDEDENRHNEKMDLMNACKLRPVSQTQSLRDVRISKVTPPTVVIKKGKGPEARPRAKKTFPQPRRAEELNGKNSMVYIPIQPPNTQAPIRNIRPVLNGPTQPSGPRPTGPSIPGNSGVNTVTTPLKPMSTLGNPTTTTTTLSLPNNMALAKVSGPLPNVGQVPTTVHTVPLMTSVNGQWMFSLQPIMSVGGIDSSGSPKLVNGMAERTITTQGLLPIATSNSGTPTLITQANKTTDANTPSELPRLQQKPLVNPFDATATISVPVPSIAGPLSAKLNQNAVKLTDFFRTLLEDSLEKIDEPVAKATALKIEMEQLRWRHQQELKEAKHNLDLSLAEMRLSFEKEKLRITNDARRAAQQELEAAVKVAKSKQWCANCGEEAQFYCCWNTSYCEHACQRAHWPQHFSTCAQPRQDGTEDTTTSTEVRLQSQKEIPKSAPAQTPTLTVGGRVAPTRVFSAPDTTQTQKSSIIVSMVEDISGTQTMKCVGTYKSPKQAPMIINKQIVNEESGKKVVTSGGYLIVGASGNNSAVVTPAPTTRRPHTIQYFS